ncbi:hypothetical protein MRX96_026818 [Rhipicephalus microplus]
MNNLQMSNIKVLGPARSLLAQRHGCTLAFALQVYNAIASARVIYMAAITSLSTCELGTLEVEHSSTVREYDEIPNDSLVRSTLAEAGETPIFLRVTQRIISDIQRLKTTMQGYLLLNRLSHSVMGQRASERLIVGTDTHNPSWPAIPPYRQIPLVTTKAIGGIETKARTPLAAMQQECSTLRCLLTSTDQCFVTAPWPPLVFCHQSGWFSSATFPPSPHPLWRNSLL